MFWTASTLHNTYFDFASASCIARPTVTLVARDQILAGTVVNAWRWIALVIFKLAQLAAITRQAVTLEFANAVFTHPMNARFWFTFIDVYFTVRSLKSWWQIVPWVIKRHEKATKKNHTRSRSARYKNKFWSILACTYDDHSFTLEDRDNERLSIGGVNVSSCSV